MGVEHPRAELERMSLILTIPTATAVTKPLTPNGRLCPFGNDRVGKFVTATPLRPVRNDRFTSETAIWIYRINTADSGPRAKKCTSRHSVLYSFIHITHTRNALYNFSFPALYLSKQDRDSALDTRSSHFYGLEFMICLIVYECYSNSYLL